MTEQLEPEARVAGQVLPVMLKSPGLAPVSAMLDMATALLPVLVMTTLWPVLVVPVFWVPKLRLVGFKPSESEGVKPVPLSGTDCGLPVPLEVSVRLAARAPAVVGGRRPR